MNPGGVSRRTLLRGVAGGLTSPLVSRLAVPATGLGAAAGCTTLRDPVEVVVVWSGTELDVFREVVAEFEREHDATVDLVSGGDGFGELLGTRIVAGHPPDVAVLPNPGLLRSLSDSGDLASLDEVVPDTASWQRQLVTGTDGVRYGTWVKVTHKSVFWFHPDGPFPHTYRPATLGDLVADLTEVAARGRRPLSMGAADGWVLTDWFENALLAVNRDTYDELATGERRWGSPDVTEALRWLGRIWSIPRVFADGPERALLTQYDEAALRTFTGDGSDAAVIFGGDYIALLLVPYQAEDMVPSRLGSFRFPPGERGGRMPLLAGGDAAVLLRQPGDDVRNDAKKLVGWLSRAETAQLLAGKGFLTVHTDDPKYLSAIQPPLPGRANTPVLLTDLAGQVREESLRFDLSDRLRRGLARSDGQGLVGILQRFFAKVAERGEGAVESAVKDARGQIVYAAAVP
jgi:alpha-glucoside transport system substrate-binding protein